MSDKAISVGDLVQCINDCCGNRLGLVFTVEKILPADRRRCSKCGFVIYESAAANYTLCQGAPLSWLKRIPPLDELEGERTEEPLYILPKEPA